MWLQSWRFPVKIKNLWNIIILCFGVFKQCSLKKKRKCVKLVSCTLYKSIIQNMNWSTILNKEIGMCTISFIASRYHLKQYDQLKWMWKNILIVNNNFVFTIGLPYCYLPFKVIFRTNYFHEIVWPTSHVLLIYMHKNKGHNYYYSTSERQSSYNRNNFIFLMKFNTNRNNVSIEDNL